MRGNKIDAPNLSYVGNSVSPTLKKTPVYLFAAGVFLCPSFGCVMTKAQGEKLTHKVLYLEDEVAKLQRVRHDMEVLLVGQVREIIDRIARLENQVTAFKDSLSEGSSRNIELLTELQNLRGELELAQDRYKNLEADQQSLAKNQIALKEAQAKIRVPPLKADHFALAKKYYVAEKCEEAILLFEQFLKDYQSDLELSLESQYYLGDCYFKLAESKTGEEDREKLQKRSVVAFQKVVETDKEGALRAEALFKLGRLLKALDNPDGAIVAFKELLAKHKKSKRVKEAKVELADLEKNKK